MKYSSSFILFLTVLFGITLNSCSIIDDAEFENDDQTQETTTTPKVIEQDPELCEDPDEENCP